MPSTHLMDVTQKRAILLFSIVKGHSIDVGQVIHSSIWYALQGGSTSGLLHPLLITGLCKQAGVIWDKDEVIEPPKAVIDFAMIKRFKIWDRVASHPRGQDLSSEVLRQVLELKLHHLNNRIFLMNHHHFRLRKGVFTFFISVSDGLVNC